MPGSRLEIFEGVGHFPHAEDPARFTRVLLDFLATTEPAVGSRRRVASCCAARRRRADRYSVRAGFGSLGSPRMRSPMMLRWI